MPAKRRLGWRMEYLALLLALAAGGAAAGVARDAPQVYQAAAAHTAPAAAAGPAKPAAFLSAPAGIPKFPLAPGPLVYREAFNPHRFINAVGERSGLWGFENGELEGWVYPLKLFHAFQLDFQLAGLPRRFRGSELLTGARIYPQMVVLQYAAEMFQVREILFAPRHAPGFIILLDVHTPRPLRIYARFTPDLSLMWPAALGGQTYDWDAVHKRMLLAEPTGRFTALIGSPFATGSTAVGYHPYLTTAHPNQVIELRVTPRAARRDYIPIVAAAGIRGIYHARLVYRGLLRRLPQMYAASLRHYARLLSRGPRLQTPGAAINRSLRWSRVALDQFHVCNPYLGCGYVSGYGPSGTSTRPMYAWYFDEPAISAAAFLETGQAAGLKQALEFLQKYQRADGKIPHEISQSAGLIPWFKNYPYPYIHTDSPLWYLIAVGRYLRFTGDLAFVRQSWPHVLQAYRYCVSILDPADGLPAIPAGDWGSIELLGFRKDAGMAGEWLAALRAVRRLAAVQGDAALVRECRRRARQASASLEREFWNPRLGFYNYGRFSSGRPVTYLNPAIGYAAWLGVLPKPRAKSVLEKLATASFLSDWGQRNMSFADPRYKEGSYHVGSAWPFLTAAPMLAQFRDGNPVEGLLIWRSMLALRNFDAPGDLPESLSGSYFRLLDEGVPHQMFSELTAVPGLVEGVMGIDPDVPRRTLAWRPQLPPSWPRAAVRAFPFGPEAIDFSLRQSPGKLQASIRATAAASAAQPLQLRFAPALPMGASVISVTQDSRPLRFTVQDLGSEVRVNLAIRFTRSAQIEVRYRGGVALEPHWQPLLAGDRSRNLHVLRYAYRAGMVTMTVEGRPGRSYLVRAYTFWKLTALAGARVQSGRNGAPALVLQSPPGRLSTDKAGYVRWRVRVRAQ